MLMKILKNKYVIAWVIVFALLTLIGIFALDTSWWESGLYSAILSAVGVGGFWWKEEVW